MPKTNEHGHLLEEYVGLSLCPGCGCMTKTFTCWGCDGAICGKCNSEKP